MYVSKCITLFSSYVVLAWTDFHVLPENSRHIVSSAGYVPCELA